MPLGLDRLRDLAEVPLRQQVYEGLIGGAAGLLKNRQRGEVATRFKLSGPPDDPEISSWEVVTGLLRNAFLKAILPGFDREDRRPERSRSG